MDSLMDLSYLDVWQKDKQKLSYFILLIYYSRCTLIRLNLSTS